MKTRLNIGYLALLMGLAVSCTDQQSLTTDKVSYASILNVTTDGLTTVITPNLEAALVETPDLLADELTVLIKMKEEEKLARDVYSTLSVKWTNAVFSRISVAENNHMNAIVDLLKYCETADTLVAEAGVFQNEELQKLYTDLVAKGSVSLIEAMNTGALIEELDIKDLQDGLLATTNENITLVFENLERGSRNHLRSFNKQLTALGVVYTPVYITQSEFDSIVSSSIEKGKGYEMNGKGHGLHGGNSGAGCDSSGVRGHGGGGRHGRGGH